MSVLTQFMPGRARRRQVFTSSGTFTPSARLLALGGWVEVLCVGGGGGSYRDSSNVACTGGGGGGVVSRIVQVSGPVAVTIGAGGTGGTNPTQGGTTSFGSLVSAPGGGPGSTYGGQSGNGLRSFHAGGAGAGGAGGAGVVMSGSNPVGTVSTGGPALRGYGRGGAGCTRLDLYGINTFSAPPNTGHGGSGGDAGASGICIVEWWE